MEGVRGQLGLHIHRGTLISLIAIPAISKSHPIHSSSHSFFVHWKFLAFGWKWALATLRTHKERTYWSSRFLKGHSIQMPPVPSMCAIGLKPGASRTPLESQCMHLMLHPLLKYPLRLGHGTFKRSLNLRLSWPKLTYSNFEVFISSLVWDFVVWNALHRALKSVQRIEAITLLECFCSAQRLLALSGHKRDNPDAYMQSTLCLGGGFLEHV